MIRSQCFTATCPGRANVLVTSVHINDPLVSPLPNPITFDKEKNLYQAIWDTGATNTCISDKVVADFSFQPIGVVQVMGAAGMKVQNQYIIDLLLPNGVVFQGITVTGCQISGAELLIGMDIIGSGDFAVTLKEGKTVFSYRHPNNGCIDFVDLQNHADIAILNPGGRNLPCRCGSGKKFKECHGK